jgi:hypothetical protein
MASIAYLIQQRDKARAYGDKGQARAIDADLARQGYHGGTAPEIVSPVVFETTVADEPLERAVPEPPKKKRGPAAKPRCEHGKIADRCADCNDDREVL